MQWTKWPHQQAFDQGDSADSSNYAKREDFLATSTTRWGDVPNVFLHQQVCYLLDIVWPSQDLYGILFMAHATTPTIVNRLA